MFSAYLVWWLVRVWHWPVGLAAALVLLVVAPGLGLLIDALVFRPLQRREAVPAELLAAALGVLVLLLGIAYAVWGGQARTDAPSIVPDISFQPTSGAVVRLETVVDLLAVVIVAGGLTAVLRTRAGLNVRAVVERRELGRARRGGHRSGLGDRMGRRLLPGRAQRRAHRAGPEPGPGRPDPRGAGDHGGRRHRRAVPSRHRDRRRTGHRGDAGRADPAPPGRRPVVAAGRPDREPVRRGAAGGAAAHAPPGGPPWFGRCRDDRSSGRAPGAPDPAGVVDHRRGRTGGAPPDVTGQPAPGPTSARPGHHPRLDRGPERLRRPDLPRPGGLRGTGRAVGRQAVGRRPRPAAPGPRPARGAARGPPGRAGRDADQLVGHPQARPVPCPDDLRRGRRDQPVRVRPARVRLRCADRTASARQR